MKTTYTTEELIKLKVNAAWLSLIIGILLFGVKMFAFFLTNSKAIFSDALESIVHIVATLVALYSIILSSKPADKSHLYGHGNIEYFSAGTEGLLIIIAAVTIFYFSILDLLGTPQPKELDYGTALIALAGIVNLVLGLHLVKTGKKTNSVALIADGKHILTDSFTSIGIVIGLIIVLFSGILILDPIIAILVAVNIVYTGYKLIRESISGLMMETDEELLVHITNIFNDIKKTYLIDIHQLRFWKSAEKVFVDFHLTLPFYYTVKQSHDIEEEITESFKKEIPSSEIRIHFDFCESDLCKYCNIELCDFRSESFSKTTAWTSDKLIEDPIHLG